jgi:hypothetical protein
MPVRPRIRRISVVVFGVIGVGVVGAIVVAVLAHRLFAGQARGEPDQEPALGEAAQLPADSGRIFALVAPLLNDPDWTDARIASVNAGLLEEGSRRIAAARRFEWFQRFAAQVRVHLEDQRVQRHNSAAPERSSLSALAVTIGLDLNALDEPPRSSTRVFSPGSRSGAKPTAH